MAVSFHHSKIQGAFVAHYIPTPNTVRCTSDVFAWLARRPKSRTLSMLHQIPFVKHSIERGLRCDVLPAVGQSRHDLSRALVARLGAVRGGKRSFALRRAQLMSGGSVWTSSLIVAAVLNPPALYGERAEIRTWHAERGRAPLATASSMSLRITRRSPASCRRPVPPKWRGLLFGAPTGRQFQPAPCPAWQLLLEFAYAARIVGPRRRCKLHATQRRLAPRSQVGLVNAMAAQELTQLGVSKPTGFEDETKFLFGGAVLRPLCAGVAATGFERLRRLVTFSSVVASRSQRDRVGWPIPTSWLSLFAQGPEGMSMRCTSLFLNASECYLTMMVVVLRPCCRLAAYADRRQLL